MEVLIYKIHALLRNWTVLCPVEKRDILSGVLWNLKIAAKMVLWLPDIPRGAA
jgi:hypothetical protein